MINAETEPTINTKGLGQAGPKPAIPAPDPIDLDRVVFDPEYRALVRDALNRAGRGKRSWPTLGSRS